MWVLCQTWQAQRRLPLAKSHQRRKTYNLQALYAIRKIVAVMLTEGLDHFPLAVEAGMEGN